MRRTYITPTLRTWHVEAHKLLADSLPITEETTDYMDVKEQEVITDESPSPNSLWQEW